MLRFWTLSLFLVLLPGAAGAQDPAQPPVFGAGTGLVLVDFVVTDKGGRAVAGLSAQDFLVREDGKERPILSFLAFGGGQPTFPPGSPTTKPEAPPLPPSGAPEAATALVVDDCRIGPAQAGRLNDALKALIEGLSETPGHLSLVAPASGVIEVRTLPGDGVADLGGAVDRITTFPKPRCNVDAERYTYGVYDLMIESMKWLADRPGRHTVVLVSAGFIHRNDDVRRNEVVTHSLRANAPIHFLDIRGNDGVGSYRDVGGRAGFGGIARQPGVLEWSRVTEGASSLADDTGGLTIRNGNDLLKGYGRVLDGIKTYYLLGYQAPERAKPGFRKINVEARTKDLHVRARRGYFDDAMGSR